MRHGRFWVNRRRALAGALAAAALGTVLVAPLATGSGPAGATTIGGAQSLADKVQVQFQRTRDRTTDVHVLAWNDFHGNLEATAGAQHLWRVRRGRCVARAGREGCPQEVPREGAGGRRRRQHRCQPARQRLVPRGAGHDRDESHAPRLRVGWQPRVRQGQGRAAAHPERRLLVGRSLPGGGALRPAVLPPTNRYPGANFQYLSANVVVDATGKTLFPAYGIKWFLSDSWRLI